MSDRDVEDLAPDTWLIPDGSAAQAESHNELERMCTSAECTARIFSSVGKLDVMVLDNAQIAARLGLSEKTLRKHITRIFEKMRVETRAHA
jgi:DNA-directed RNA polymerase specialized sigma24 family protein